MTNIALSEKPTQEERVFFALNKYMVARLAIAQRHKERVRLCDEASEALEQCPEPTRTKYQARLDAAIRGC